MRIREPKTTALIFNNGKVVVTGAKSKAKSMIAARKFARVVQKIGYDVKFKDFRIRNMVASVDMTFGVNVTALSHDPGHGSFASYEPEIFPGLVYHMVVPSVVLLIFTTGKVVITGAKCESDIHTARDNIVPVIRQFRSNTQPPEKIKKRKLSCK